MSTKPHTVSADDIPVELRYPIGRFQWPAHVTAADRQAWIQKIEEFPIALTAAVSDLNEAQLDTRYRPGGWTVRQLVHHVADSHINSYARFRLALTEDNPPIRGYDENAWAELPDAKTAPVRSSLAILTGIHERWGALLRHLTDEQWARTFQHSERGAMRLDATAGLYAWHGAHHVAHVRSLRERESW